MHNSENTADPTHALRNGLSVSQDGPVTLLRLSRPAKRNALDREMIAGIEDFFRSPPDGTRAVVLHGEGSNFSAGLDLSNVADISVAEGISHSRAWHRAFEQIEYCQVPVIVVMHGAVIGGGLELAAAAHIRVAERSAFYALPEGNHGIFVGGGGSVRIPRLIGTARTMDMMLTGRTYGAEEGAAIGVSQYVVADGQGFAHGIALAKQIIANASLTNFGATQVLPRIVGANPETGLLMESLMAAIAGADDDARTRLRNFLEKRAPKVAHRAAGVSEAMIQGDRNGK
jgi:(methylthio)acryloyl-CoA hydratase